MNPMHRVRQAIVALVLIATLGIVAVSARDYAFAGGKQIKTTPWVVQVQEAVPNTDDDHIVNAFQPGTIPTPSVQEVPPWAQNAEVIKCQVIHCLVDVPGWAMAVIIGGYNLGEDKLPGATKGHAVQLINVGEKKVSFGYAAMGGSYIVIVPYPDGRPSELAKFAASVTGYIANIALFPDRSSSIPMEWNNQCSVTGCQEIRIAGYIFAYAPDRPSNALTRFIHYFRIDIQK